MNTPLIGLDKLLSESWKAMFKDWRPTLGWTLGMIFVPALVQIAFLLPQIAEPKLAQNPLYHIALFLIIYFVALYFMAGLFRYFLDKKSEVKVSFQDVVALAWIGALGGIILIPAFLLFILPGIWLSIMFCFAIPVYLKEGKKGWSALKTSYAIVKGRWWATFIRFLVPQLIYGFGLSIFMGIFGVVYVMLIASTSGALITAMNQNAPLEQILAAISPVSIGIAGVGGFVFIILMIIVTILLTLARVSIFTNLYKSLSETAAK